MILLNMINKDAAPWHYKKKRKKKNKYTDKEKHIM